MGCSSSVLRNTNASDIVPVMEDNHGLVELEATSSSEVAKDFQPTVASGVATDPNSPPSVDDATPVHPKFTKETRWNSMERPARSSLRTFSSNQARSGEAREGSSDRDSSHAENNAPHVVFGEGVEFPEAGDGHPQSYKKGNELSMKKIVDEFYSRVLADPLLKPFFDGVDMRKLKHQQEKLMLLAFGGSELLAEESASSFDLRRIHRRLLAERGLTVAHWERFVEIFENSLNAMPEMPAEASTTAMQSIRTTKVYFEPLTPGES